MSKTKKLTTGIPIVDANGAVTPVSITELARQVGAELGVQHVKFPNLKSIGTWYRLASFNSSCSAIFMLGHRWNSGSSAGVTLSLNAASAGGSSTKSLVQLSGSPNTFSKFRYVIDGETGDLGQGHIDTFIPENRQFELRLSVITNDAVDLYSTLEPAPSVDGLKVYEITTQQMGGGITTALSALYAALSQKGARHECEDKNSVAATFRGRNIFTDSNNSGRCNSKICADEFLPAHGFSTQQEARLERSDRDRFLRNPRRSLHELSGNKRGSFDRISVACVFTRERVYRSDSHLRNVDFGNVCPQRDKRNVEQLGSILDSGDRPHLINARKEVVAA